ncbi:MAG: aspartate dehydrogenase [Thermoplasmatales archaeon]|nr:aspartate dehydrogenase [Thermoplasmatales archaeon]
MKLGIIGCGAIGTDVARAADEIEEIEEIYLYDIIEEKAKNLAEELRKAKFEKVEKFLDKVDFVFEAASQKAVYEYAEKIVSKGKDLVIMTIGALFDDEFRERLIRKAKEGKAKIYLPSGAVAGLDAIKAASIGGLDEVTLVTTKAPEAFGMHFDRRTVIYEGNAREAVKHFPKNINVAACLSLAGIGFDNTKVKIVADPVIKYNSHKILAHGKFGRLRAEVENLPNPKNPSTSYLASLSAIAVLKKIVNPLQIGI